MKIETDELVIPLRTDFLKQAVKPVRALVAKREIYDATIAGAELQRYFEGIRETISAEERVLLSEEIQTLPGSSRITQTRNQFTAAPRVASRHVDGP